MEVEFRFEQEENRGDWDLRKDMAGMASEQVWVEQVSGAVNLSYESLSCGFCKLWFRL